MMTAGQNGENHGYRYHLLKELTVIAHSPDDAAQLHRFICRVESELRACILETNNNRSNTKLTVDLITCRIGHHRFTFSPIDTAPSKKLINRLEKMVKAPARQA